MERENKRVCIVCGKELEKYFQHKYCSKACESLDRKGKKVGSYDEDRVQAMALAKKDAYKKRNLEPLSSDIRELIKYGYISDLPSLAYHLKKLQPDNTSINSNRLKKYFNYYPEDYKIFLNAKKFPKMFQKRDPSWFRNYEKFLEDKNINGWIFYKKIKNEDFIINSNISLYDLEKSCTILGYNFSERYSKIEDVLNNNNQKISRKWTEAKKILEEANFEEFFKTPIVVGAWEEWKSVVREKGKSLGVSFCMCKRYIEEKNIKINLEYSDEKLAFYKLKKYLKISEEDINLIKNDLERAQNYLEMKNILNDFLFEKELLKPEDSKGKKHQKYLFVKKYFADISPNFKAACGRKMEGDFWSYSPEGGSSLEVWMINTLKDLGIPFETQVPIKSPKKGGVYKIDILINNSACVEMQGDYWHAHPLEFEYTPTSSKINSVFPLFKYPQDPHFEKKKLNDTQKGGIKRELEKYSLLCKKFGAENVYYIWEYDVSNYPKEVIKFIKETFL